MLNMSKYDQHAQYAFVLKLLFCYFTLKDLNICVSNKSNYFTLGSPRLSENFLQQILRNTKVHTV